ncbi:MAG: class II aldolase/adducin family protein [Dethiobacter sp.]|nr:class II aldolase/adducin family protein [Dethiobacter sp.]MCL5982281.1 class II aldolase/adducin family protein [Bacillota bacterium]
MNDKRNLLVTTAREMCRDALVLGTWGNVSVRADNESMWITPSGLPYESMTAGDLVLLRLDGTALSGRWKASSEWRLHAALYKARPDCGAIVHTHSVYATAFAVAHTPVLPVVEDLAQVVGGGVEVAEYALPGTELLAENAVRALGDRSAVLLANHGLVGLAGDLSEALKVCRVVEKAAQALLLARLLGPVQPLSREDVRMMRDFYLKAYGPGLGGEVSK